MTNARLAAAALLVAGCGQILGVGTYRVGRSADASAEDGAPGAPEAAVTDGPPRSGSCGDIVYGSKTCGDCVYAHCCTEAALCNSDPACVATVQCEEHCTPGDEACRSRCAYIWGFDATTVDGLTQCEATHCGVCASSRSLVTDPICTACEAEKCPDALDALSEDADALALSKCSQCSPQTTCIDECATRHAAGQATLDALDACNTGPCAVACTQRQPDWGCLGSVVWPAPALPVKPIDLVFHLVKSEDFTTPLVGFHVSACLEQDVGCATPRVAGDTDSTGLFRLTLPPPPNLQTWFFGHLLVTSDDPNYEPALLYMFPPRRQSSPRSGNWYPLPSRSTYAATSAALGLARDPTKGIVAFDGYSCGFALRGGQGVVVSIDSGERVYYYGSSGTPDANATETSAGGLGFIANVTPGIRTLETKRATATGERIGTFTVQVVAAAVTEIAMGPTPAAP